MATAKFYIFSSAPESRRRDLAKSLWVVSMPPETECALESTMKYTPGFRAATSVILSSAAVEPDTASSQIAPA